MKGALDNAENVWRLATEVVAVCDKEESYCDRCIRSSIGDVRLRQNKLQTTDFIAGFPLYYHMKFAFLVWLQLPSADGARHLYMSHLRPFLLRHQARLDQIVGFAYGEMAKFISAHQAEFQFVRGMLTKILVSANQMLRDIIHPVQARGHSAIEGPRRQIQDSESDHDD